MQILSAVAIRLTKITGKSKYPVHPKHLIKKKLWYREYLSKNDTLLDMGTNTGQHAIDASRYVRQVAAFDFDRKLLGIALQKAKDSKVNNIRFIKANAEKKLPFKDNLFTAVLCLDVLEHLKNESSTLREIKRVLRPNGKLFLSLPNSETSWKRRQKSEGLFYYSDPDHKREYSKKAIEKLCRKNKFHLIFIEPVTLDTPLAPIIDLVGGFSLTIYKYLSEWKKKQIVVKPQDSVGYQIYVTNTK